MFAGRKGWFAGCKSRSKCCHVKLTVEAENAGTESAEAFSTEFQPISENGEYTEDLIFNVDTVWKEP